MMHDKSYVYYCSPAITSASTASLLVVDMLRAMTARLVPPAPRLAPVAYRATLHERAGRLLTPDPKNPP